MGVSPKPNNKQQKGDKKMLTLQLQKPGEEAPKLKLALNKGAKFSVELYWDSQHDLDAHALEAINGGQGAKINALEQVLSCYNLKPNGALTRNPNGSFSLPSGMLTHSGDCRDGKTQDVDEIITIDGSKAPSGVNEVPIFVTIHNADKSGATFAQVKDAGIRIKDESGKLLGEYNLSNEFGSFNAIQMGSLILGDNGWEFAPVGAGFNGDFNTVLGSFA